MAFTKVKSEYVLKRFESSRNKDFIKALNLYSKYMPEHLYTSANEVMYWLNSNGTDTEREMYIFGLYYNSILVGYMQLAYFYEEKVLFLDYIVLHPEYRRNNTFSVFFEMLDKFIDENELPVNYIATEIIRFKDIIGEIADETGLIGRFEIEGFQRLEYPYFQLPLGVNEDNSVGAAIDAVLLVKYFNQQDMSSREYKGFITMILFKHYLKWYTPFLTKVQYNYYKETVEKMYNRLSNQIVKENKKGGIDNEFGNS